MCTQSISSGMIVRGGIPKKHSRREFLEPYSPKLEAFYNCNLMFFFFKQLVAKKKAYIFTVVNRGDRKIKLRGYENQTTGFRSQRTEAKNQTLEILKSGWRDFKFPPLLKKGKLVGT